MPQTATALKLHALDAKSLAVISAHAQDSCVPRKEMLWLPAQKRFVFTAMRYDWAAAKLGRHERIGAVLRFDRVLKVAQLGLAERDPDAMLHLLAITFEKTDPPSGLVMLAFSDGAAVRLDVECLEGELRDIGPRLPAQACPGHALTLAQAD